jgi:methylenetetrahydrofolate reductase (NADPH)
VVRRLRSVPGDQVGKAGIDLCVETIGRIREIPGVAGVHVMAFGFEQGVAEIVERAAIGPSSCQ